MNGELAQLVTVSAHGSVWLAGEMGPDPPRLDESNWTFRYVGNMWFRLERRDGLIVEADDLAGWFRQLRDRGVERLWLTAGERPAQAGRGAGFDERYLVAFAGAGSWSMLATGAVTESWWAGWTVGDQKAPDRRIWNVGYRGVELPKTEMPAAPSIAQAGLRLREALHAAAEFARSQGLDQWSGVFDSALRAGAADDDLLHPAAAAEARALAATASRAWVFGGMGSWNDLSFDGDAQVRSERVSEELYRATLEALVAATNA